MTVQYDCLTFFCFVGVPQRHQPRSRVCLAMPRACVRGVGFGNEGGAPVSKLKLRIDRYMIDLRPAIISAEDALA